VLAGGEIAERGPACGPEQLEESPPFRPALPGQAQGQLGGEPDVQDAPDGDGVAPFAGVRGRRRRTRG
jgi:hypothetical protein